MDTRSPDADLARWQDEGALRQSRMRAGGADGGDWTLHRDCGSLTGGGPGEQELPSWGHLYIIYRHPRELHWVSRTLRTSCIVFPCLKDKGSLETLERPETLDTLIR